MTGTRAVARASAAALAFCLLALAACQKRSDHVPELQPQAPIDARAQVEGFGLVAAGRGFSEGELALQLEFSQPLVASQSFDELLSVTGPKGEVVSGSWVLDESAKILRFPYVQAGLGYAVRVRAGLAAADGATLGKDLEQKIYTGPMEPAAAFA